MSYYKSSEDAVKDGLFGWRNPPDKCFGCGKNLGGPIVVYDGYDEEKSKTIWMHRNCSFEMAQRMICDAWPNRREDNK